MRLEIAGGENGLLRPSLLIYLCHTFVIPDFGLYRPGIFDYFTN